MMDPRVKPATSAPQRLPRCRKRQFVGGEFQTGNFAIEFFSKLGTLKTPEGQFVVDKVGARIPAFADRGKRADTEAGIFLFDFSPVRLPGIHCARHFAMRP